MWPTVECPCREDGTCDYQSSSRPGWNPGSVGRRLAMGQWPATRPVPTFAGHQRATAWSSSNLAIRRSTSSPNVATICGTLATYAGSGTMAPLASSTTMAIMLCYVMLFAPKVGSSRWRCIVQTKHHSHARTTRHLVRHPHPTRQLAPFPPPLLETLVVVSLRAAPERPRRSSCA